MYNLNSNKPNVSFVQLWHHFTKNVTSIFNIDTANLRIKENKIFVPVVNYSYLVRFCNTDIALLIFSFCQTLLWLLGKT